MFHNHAYKAEAFTSLLRKRTSLPSPTEQRRCDLNAIQLYVKSDYSLIFQTYPSAVLRSPLTTRPMFVAIEVILAVDFPLAIK